MARVRLTSTVRVRHGDPSSTARNRHGELMGRVGHRG